MANRVDTSDWMSGSVDFLQRRDRATTVGVRFITWSVDKPQTLHFTVEPETALAEYPLGQDLILVPLARWLELTATARGKEESEATEESAPEIAAG